MAMRTRSKDTSGRARVPMNERLWGMLVKQAEHRFHPYPSLVAAHWIHSEYIKSGGQFADKETVKASKESEEKRHVRKKDPEKAPERRGHTEKDVAKKEKARKKKGKK